LTDRASALRRCAKTPLSHRDMLFIKKVRQTGTRLMAESKK
jgi:hypothetical protein